MKNTTKKKSIKNSSDERKNKQKDVPDGYDLYRILRLYAFRNIHS